MDQQFLRKLLNQISVSGCEESGQKVLKEYMGQYADEIRSDEMGNVICIANPDSPVRIMLSAHADEIGLLVTRITESGRIQAIERGGIIPATYPGQKVQILTGKGIVYGAVEGYRELYKKNDLKAADLLIDIGATSKEEAARYVALGDTIVPDTGMRELINGRMGQDITARDAETVEFHGKCPAGNVGVQVNHIDPVNKGEVVWTVDPTVVIFIGRLFNTGHVDLRRLVAIAGSEVKNPHYEEILVGQSINPVISGQYDETSDVRVIMGNPLTGRPMEQTADGGAIHHTRFLSAHTSEITIIPEGDKADEFAGWIMPRLNQFSVSRSYFSWLFCKKKAYRLDARIKGGERHMIMSGEYDKVLPMDIYAEYLIKAIITGDIDKQEQLGIYEVSPEDFALAEFVDSSKLELQRIVREGLDVLRKENE